MGKIYILNDLVSCRIETLSRQPEYKVGRIKVGGGEDGPVSYANTIDQLQYNDQLEHHDHRPPCSFSENSIWNAKYRDSESLQHSQQHS